MGRSGFGRESYDEALAGILYGKYKYLVKLIPTQKTNRVILGQYELFNELDKEKIKAYAEEVAELNSIQEKMKFKGAEAFSLEAKVVSLNIEF
jgi:hypothetical protein